MSSSPPTLSELMDLARETAIGPIPESTGGMESWHVLLTPDLAAWLLECNTSHNRRLALREVDQIAADIVAGRWKANGDTIKVSDAGKLVDGQHRCEGVITADIAVPTMIVFGVPDDKDTMATIDTTGRPRSVRDIYEIATGKKADNSHLATTNLLGRLTGGVDLNGKPRQFEYLAAHIDEVAPWLSWAEMISRCAPLVVNPMMSGKATVRTIGKTPLAVLAVHMVRAGADPDAVQDFYAAMVGELTPSQTRTMTDNQLAISQIMLKRLKNGKVLNRLGGGAHWMILPEYAVHIRTYNRWVQDQKMEMARQSAEVFRYLGELPAVSTQKRVTA